MTRHLLHPNQCEQRSTRIKRIDARESVLTVPLDEPWVIELDGVIQPSTIDALQTTDVYHLGTKTISAYAAVCGDEKQIFFSAGLAELIDFGIGSAFLAREMEDGNFSFTDQYDEPHTSFTPTLMCLIGKVYFHLDFPDLSRLWQSEQAARNLRSHAFLAFLCHELGHLELGHFVDSDENLKIALPMMFETEEFDRYKSHEFAADEFMLHSFVDPSAAFFAFLIVLNMMAPLEIVEARLKNAVYKRRHPFLINRIANLMSAQSDNNSDFVDESSKLLAEYLHSLSRDDVMARLISEYTFDVYQDFNDQFQNAIDSVYGT